MQLQLDTPHIHDCSYKKALVQPDSITDVQVGVARLMVLQVPCSKQGSTNIACAACQRSLSSDETAVGYQRHSLVALPDNRRPAS